MGALAERIDVIHFSDCSSPTTNDADVIENTNLALALIFDRDPNWVKSKTRKLPSTDDFEAASSLLGEIRAYGSLLSVGLETQPSLDGKSGPDFLVENDVFVEVHTKQSDPEERDALYRFNRAPHIANFIHPNSPFGAPKQGDGVTRIAIQKLAQIKQKEERMKRQFSEVNPSILWLDFQDETWNLIMNADSATAVTLWNDEYYSGPLWYAFYGWKGAPVFHGETKLQRPRRTVARMLHDGRFRQGGKIDAVVATLPRDTIILENPFSQKPIQFSILENLSLLRNFNHDYSFINWPGKI